MYNWNLPVRLKRGKTWKLIPMILLFSSTAFAQENAKDSTLDQATLKNCVHYAIAHNPNLQNAKINEAIIETEIKSKLSDWYPQVNFNYNFQHNFQLPTLNFNGNLIHTGTVNTSGVQFGLTQNIFNSDALLATQKR